MAQACNPSFLGGREMERITVQGQDGQKVVETPSQVVDGYSGLYLSSPLCGEAQIGGSQSGLAQSYKVRPCLKNNQHRKGWQSSSSDKAPTSVRP
jgi:hypothetical protein